MDAKQIQDLAWYLCHRSSDYRAAKSVASARHLFVTPKRASRTWKTTRHLVGVAVAEKRSKGKRTGLPAITFLVTKKQPRRLLNQKDRLPKTIEGLVTDVVTVGRIRSAQGGSPTSPLHPLEPGAQIGVGGEVEAGTLGGFVRDQNGQVYLITNCHVVSGDLINGVGATVFQPAPGFFGSRQIATVTNLFQIQTDGTRNTVDLALARMDSGVQFNSTYPNGFRVTASGTPSLFEPISKYGQATLGTDGRFDSTDADIIVPYPAGDARFKNIYVFRPASFSDEGDSGSVVYEPNTGEAVGLLFARTNLVTFGIPLHAIEDVLGPLSWL